MRKEWIVPIAVLALIGLVILIGYVQQGKYVQVAQQPDYRTFKLPEGDPVAGKTAFMKMQCYSCHKINIPGETFPADIDDIGPDLRHGYHNITIEYLAESIIMAHKVVADPTYQIKADQAGMGKYNDYMTVLELTDLVAFIKQPPIVAKK
jgi:hypothetical protein